MILLIKSCVIGILQITQSIIWVLNLTPADISVISFTEMENISSWVQHFLVTTLRIGTSTKDVHGTFAQHFHTIEGSRFVTSKPFRFAVHKSKTIRVVPPNDWKSSECLEYASTLRASEALFRLFIVSREICLNKNLEYLVSCSSICIGLINAAAHMPNIFSLRLSLGLKWKN